jgi:hypothetical protein
MLRYIFILLFVLSAHISKACTCEQLPPLTKAMVQKYNVVFTGRVLAVSDNGKESKAHFIVSEVYHGGLYKEVDVQYDSESDCGMTFIPGETWTIYGNWIAYGLPVTDMCTHSRKLPAKGEQDFYGNVGRGTWDQETTFLKDSIGVKKFLDPSDFKDLTHKNELPGAMQALLYLVFGLGGLLAIYFAVKRIFKNDGKQVS